MPKAAATSLAFEANSGKQGITSPRLGRGFETLAVRRQIAQFAQGQSRSNGAILTAVIENEHRTRNSVAADPAPN
jgi:hypothetical protein